MRALTEVGLNLQELNKPAQAAVFLEQALALSRRSQKRTTPDRADALVGLGRARLARGRLTDALRLLQEADRFWREFDADNRWAGETALWLGRCQDAVGQSSDARTVRSRATTILSRSSLQADARLLQLAQRD